MDRQGQDSFSCDLEQRGKCLVDGKPCTKPPTAEKREACFQLRYATTHPEEAQAADVSLTPKQRERMERINGSRVKCGMPLLPARWFVASTKVERIETRT